MKFTSILILAMTLMGMMANASTNRVLDGKTLTSGAFLQTFPVSAGTVLNDNNSVTVTGKSMSGASNTFTAIPGTAISSGVVGVANGGTGLSSGTSGGILGFTASGVLASSSILTTNQLVLGGGAGATPTSLGSLGTTTTVLHGNAGGAPTYGAVSLTADVSGTLPIANGGTSQTTANAAFNALAPSQATNSGKFLTTDGTNTSWATVSGSGANVILSNLTSPTAINQDLIFNKSNARTETQDKTGVTNSESIYMESGTVVDGTSGNATVLSGDASGTGGSGDATISSGSSAANNSGQVIVGSGASGSASGALSLFTGDPGINFNSGGLNVFTGAVTGSGQSGNITSTTGNSVDAASGSGVLASGNVSGAGTSGEVNIHSGDNSGSGATGGAQVRTGTASGIGASGPVTIGSGDSTSAATGTITLQTGAASAGGSTGGVFINTGLVTGAGDSGSFSVITGGGQSSGSVSFATGSSAADFNTGSMIYTTANASGVGGSGNHLFTTGSVADGTSGNFVIDIGVATGTGTHGVIKLNDTTAVVGYVFTATNTDGSGTWMPSAGATPIITGTTGSPTLITAGGGVTFSGTSYENTNFIAGNGGAVTVTANPQITAATNVGQRLTLIGRDATNTVTLSDGTGLSLNGTWIGGLQSVLNLEWDGTVWTEVSRR